MKGSVQRNYVYAWEDTALSGDKTRSARSVGQRLTHWATGAPIKHNNNNDNNNNKCERKNFIL